MNDHGRGTPQENIQRDGQIKSEINIRGCKSISGCNRI